MTAQGTGPFRDNSHSLHLFFLERLPPVEEAVTANKNPPFM